MGTIFGMDRISTLNILAVCASLIFMGAIMFEFI